LWNGAFCEAITAIEDPAFVAIAGCFVTLRDATAELTAVDRCTLDAAVVAGVARFDTVAGVSITAISVVLTDNGFAAIAHVRRTEWALAFLGLVRAFLSAIAGDDLAPHAGVVFCVAVLHAVTIETVVAVFVRLTGDGFTSVTDIDESVVTGANGVRLCTGCAITAAHWFAGHARVVRGITGVYAVTRNPVVAIGI
jgi:hypothetical protein